MWAATPSVCRKCCLAQTASPRLPPHHGQGALSSAWRLTSAVNRPLLFRGRIHAQLSRSRGPGEDTATHGWGPRTCLTLGVFPAKAGIHAETFQAVTASSAWTPAVAGVTVVGRERWSVNRLCCRTISARAPSNKVDDGREWPPLRAAQVSQQARRRTNSNVNRPQWLSSGGSRFSPASMRMGSTFSLGGSGHTACSVKAQGGLIALLKSRTMVFSVTFSPNRNREAG